MPSNQIPNMLAVWPNSPGDGHSLFIPWRSQTRTRTHGGIPLLNGQRQSGLATMSAFHFEEYEPVLVDTRQLDGLLSTQTGITFMKCDVEGHEDAVLAGGIELLTRERPTVLIELEERHRDEPVETAFAFFGELGYSGWAVSPTVCGRSSPSTSSATSAITWLAGVRTASCPRATSTISSSRPRTGP